MEPNDSLLQVQVIYFPESKLTTVDNLIINPGSRTDKATDAETVLFKHSHDIPDALVQYTL